MAELLYRLGRFSARRPGSSSSAGSSCSRSPAARSSRSAARSRPSFSIPGTETERVNEQLSDELSGPRRRDRHRRVPDRGRRRVHRRAAGGDQPRSSPTSASVDGVADVVDPFAAASERADQEQQLADGQAQLDAAAQQLDAGQAQLDAGQAQLDAGQAQLDAAIAQAQAAGAYDQAAASSTRSRRSSTRGAEQLAAQQAQLDDGAAELEAQQAQLDDGRRLMEAAAEIRTVSDDESTAVGAVVFDDDLISLSTEVKAAVAEALDGAGIDGVTVDYSSTIAGLDRRAHRRRRDRRRARSPRSCSSSCSARCCRPGCR